MSGASQSDGARVAARLGQRGEPEDQDRQGQHMGPRQEMRQGHGPGRRHKGERMDRLEPAQQRTRQDGERCRKGERRRQHRPVPAEAVVERREHRLGQPFMRDPGRSGNAVGENIDPRHRVMGDDPAPGDDVPESVRADPQSC